MLYKYILRGDYMKVYPLTPSRLDMMTIQTDFTTNQLTLEQSEAELRAKVNELINQGNGIDETIQDILVSLTGMVTQKVLREVNKLDLSNFTGSWHGIERPEYSEPGIQGQVTKNREDIEHLQNLIYDVTMYGAKGDNTTDDYEAINLALKEIEKNNGGTLYFPKTIANTYLTSKPLVVPSRNFTIRFESENTVLKATESMESVILDNVGHPYQSYIGVNINANNFANCGIKCSVNYAPYSYFERCTVNNAIDENINFITYMTIFNRVNTNGGKTGFYIHPTSNNIVTSITMNSCYSNNAKEIGYRITNACYSTFNSCGCDNIINGIAYNIQGRGITLNGCGCEKVNKAMLLPSARGITINGFYMNSVGNENNPTEYLIEMTGGTSLNISGLFKEQMKQYNYVIGLTGNSYGHEVINIMDSTIKKSETKQTVNVSQTGTNSIRFATLVESIDKNITCELSDLQKELDKLNNKIDSTITFNITNINNVVEKVVINSKKYGNGRIILDFSNTTFSPFNVSELIDIYNIKCNLQFKNGTFTTNVNSPTTQLIRFINCNYVVVHGITARNASGGQGGSIISAINGSRVKVLKISSEGNFGSGPTITKYYEDTLSLIIDKN